ncbi:GDSL-type esterase/lipase family protein [Streptomyces sp. DH12]|uniref:GDSL-type esterase/lipase family protein n=1 Tax=Streptomyces sp. DH12 TaxID=2857010 RepID=UPI001E52D74D|nr:GDSL-type esterase/lipase family protein [Streptomyces sp. DH12]
MTASESGGEWLDPLPFLRGTAWLDGPRAVRADPASLGVLPWDVSERAALPIGVRLEFTAAPGTRAVELRYRARVPEPGERLREVAHSFALWREGRCLTETCGEPADGEAVVRLPLPADRVDGGAYTVHPPESQAPVVLGVRAVGGEVRPAPPRPRWVVHGDSITEGWWATRPAHAWPAVAGRALRLDPVNLGYAGSARGELPVAQQLATLPASLLTLAWGTNCWQPVPTSAPLMYEVTRAFLALVRRGHPDTPLLVLSPLLRPDAESTANALGATLADLRAAMEEAVRDLRAEGDRRLALLPGLPVLTPEHLADGLHPNDAGHARVAAAVADAVRTHGLLAGRAATRTA